MAIIRNTASMMLKGKVGATTYYVADSRQLARQAMNNSNYGENASRTDLQQARRVKWSNLVNFYSANKAWMKKAYEDLKPGVSIFNRFMQLNINGADIPLTKAQAQAKIWVADAYRVSQGSLIPLVYTSDGQPNKITFPSISVTGSAAELGNLARVSELSEALLASKYGFSEGDAIAFIVFWGTFEATGSNTAIPASYQYLEFVVDSSSSALLPSTGYAFGVEDGRLTLSTNSTSPVGFAVIHTRKSGGKLLVSTQDMLITNEVAEAWNAPAQLNAAIKSYGESTTVPLAPGGSSEFGSGNDSSTGGSGDSDPGTDGDGSLG